MILDLHENPKSRNVNHTEEK